MQKKIKTIIFIFIGLIIITGCSKETTKSDALKFKEEYETLNEQQNNNNKKYRNIEIPEDNPIIYNTEEEILEKIAEKESFVIYFGFASCPWCRSVVNNLINVAIDLGITEVYYVDVKNIRDTMSLDDNNQPVVEKEGTDTYYKLLEKLDPVLENYTLTTTDGKTIDTGEKRIYAPNIVSIIDGVATNLTDGISSKQTDSNMELTDEMNNESIDKIKCSIECVVEDKEVCAAKTKC